MTDATVDSDDSVRGLFVFDESKNKTKNTNKQTKNRQRAPRNHWCLITTEPTTQTSFACLVTGYPLKLAKIDECEIQSNGIHRKPLATKRVHGCMLSTGKIAWVKIKLGSSPHLNVKDQRNKGVGLSMSSSVVQMTGEILHRLRHFETVAFMPSRSRTTALHLPQNVNWHTAQPNQRTERRVRLKSERYRVFDAACHKPDLHLVLPDSLMVWVRLARSVGMRARMA